MKKLFLLVTLSICLLSGIMAQKIQGVINDNDGKPVAGASVALLKAKDSAVVKWATSAVDGEYEFSSIAPGRYLVLISHVNFSKHYSTGFDVSATGLQTIAAISLTALPKQLGTVTVTSKKPIVEVKADKTILNVEGTINSIGSDVLELLRKSPGVVVDKDENLSMSGKNGVQVYIDGRQTPLTAKDLADYLKSIPSSQVEAIELITNPSARYDAAGNAGIINIRLKKNKAFGTNGSVNAGYAIGIYPKYNGSLSFNNRNKKLNIFGNYNANIAKGEIFVDIDRVVLDTFFQQHNLIQFDPVFQSFKTGFDYFASKKSTFGIIVNGVFVDGKALSNSRTPISYKPTGVVNKILVAGSENDFQRTNINTNFNYRYADTTGRELNIDADYGYYKLRTDQLQPNYYYNAAGTIETSRQIYRMIAPSDIYIKTLKADYSQPFKKGQLSVGGKTAFINSKNDFQRYDVYAASQKFDTLKSNNFNYKENINALYVNYNRSFKGVMIQVGVRMENTNTNGHSTGYKKNIGGAYATYDSSFERHYTNFFPSAAITFNKKPSSQWSISFSRRIDRPTYQSLNPFEFRLDEYTYQKGNTTLTPQYTNSFSLTHIYKSKLTSRLSYGHTKDIFAQITDTSEKSKVFITQKNLANQDIVSLDVSYPLQVKWYSAFFSLSSYYSHYKANFGTGRTIDLDVVAANLVMQNSFNLGKGWTAELSGSYYSPSIIQGTFTIDAYGGIDAGMQKTLLKGKANIKASVTDVFQSRWTFTHSNFAGQLVEVRNGGETRQFKINFSYRFGSSQVKAARQRRTGAEDELKRVQTN